MAGDSGFRIDERFPAGKLGLILFEGTLLAVGQNQWYDFGVGAPPILFYFSRDWDVHYGYGILTHVLVSESPYNPMLSLWACPKVLLTCTASLPL